MISILIYALKVSFAIGLFYGIYILLFKNETFFKWNRAYFLFAVLFALMFPFLNFGWILPAQDIFFNSSFLFSEIEVFADGVAVASSESNLLYAFSTPLTILCSLLIAGIFVFAVRLFLQIVSLVAQFKKLEYSIERDKKVFRVGAHSIASFSFFNNIVLNTTGMEDNEIQDILAHELVHSSQKHSIDVLLYEMLCVVLWWNPLVWLMKKEMKLNLEYLADAGVQEEKDDLREYQYLLLQINCANAGAFIVNNFNVAELKKRISMMNRKRSSYPSLAKYLLMFPLVFGLIQCNHLESEIADPAVNVAKVAHAESFATDDEAYTIVETMPKFPGGDEAMLEYIINNLRYPIDAQKTGVQGRVVLRFVVDKIGKITETEILNSIGASCDAEAVRVVKAMPNWEPGNQNGNDVAVYFTLPILFRLR